MWHEYNVTDTLCVNFYINHKLPILSNLYKFIHTKCVTFDINQKLPILSNLYSCEISNKGFTQKEGYKKHNLVHGQESDKITCTHKDCYEGNGDGGS